MINGKFFTGLPPKMIDRSGGLNRQQTNFFWPDDTQNQSSVEFKVRRRGSLQAGSRQAYAPAAAEQSISDAENKERFKKEFTRSSIQFYDNVEETPLRRNRQRSAYQAPLPQKPQNVEPPPDTSGKRKEAFASKIEFYDYADDLNNARRTDKNNKAEVERNTKNSPKLQNKQLSFDPPDEAVNFIENDVRNMRIGASPRRRNPPRQPRMPPRDEPRVSDFAEDYPPPQRQLPVLPPPPLRSRYSESDPDFDDYTPRRVPLGHRKPPAYFDDVPDDFIDAPHYLQSAPQLPLRYNEGMTTHRRTGRQVHFTYSDNDHDYTPQQMSRKVNVLKVDNDVKSSEHQQSPYSPSVAATSGPSHKHLVSNICFSDTESAAATPSRSQRRNIRSSAVNRVSVGLPD